MINKLKEFKNNLKKKMLDDYYKKYVRTTFECKNSSIFLAQITGGLILLISMMALLINYGIPCENIFQKLAMVFSVISLFPITVCSITLIIYVYELINQKKIREKSYSINLNKTDYMFNNDIKNNNIDNFVFDCFFYKDEYFDIDQIEKKELGNLSKDDIKNLVYLLDEDQKNLLLEKLHSVKHFDISELSNFIVEANLIEINKLEKKEIKEKFNDNYADIFNDLEMESGNNNQIKNLL